MSKRELTEATKEHYNTLIREVGEGYIHHRWGDHPVKRQHYRQTRRAIEKIFATKVRHVERLLEVGCGPGTWTDICLRHAGEVAVFDLSQEMIDLVKRKYVREPRVKEFICGDYAQSHHVLRDKFDVVFSARALEYMSDKAAVIKRSYEILRPRGFLIIITKNPHWRDKRWSQSPGTDGIQTDWIYWKDLQRIFAEVGFREIVVWSCAKGSYYPPYNNVAGTWLSGALDLFIREKPMRETYDFISESYLICGKV